jgi:hypothetical protein
MSFQPGYKIGLAESVLLDMFDECLPDIGFDLSFQGFRRRETEIVEEIALGRVAGLIA